MSKEIVTGANGFLGQSLVKRLDNPTCVPHEEIKDLKLDKFSKFFFLSTYGNMSFQTDDKKILQANVLDLIHVLEQKTMKLKFDSFIFLSTSSVKLPIQTMYSRTKKAAEEILLSYMDKYHIPICIIRPFSVTGVGEQSQHLIPVLIDSCFTGKMVNFDPNPVHDFIDIDDVTDGIISLANHSARGIFELGTGISHTNQQVLEIVEKTTGKKANINIVGRLRDYDTNDNWVSFNFKARGYGWFPKKTLEQSITEMVQVYKRKV